MLSGIIDPFSNRSITSFGLSIGTGLALESLFTPTEHRYDETREVPINIKPKDYKLHAYNVYTLMRNIVSATEGESIKLLKSKHLKSTLLFEIEVIKAIYEDAGVEVMFYANDYKSIYKKFNIGKNVKPNKAYEEYLLMDSNFKTLDKLPTTLNSVLVLTSYVSDLINVNSNYHMLESHTGKLKKRTDFSSKLHPIGKRDLSMIPFNKYTLYLLGDKTIVRPIKVSDRVKVYNVAMEKRWNNRTSDAKVISDLKNSGIGDLLTEYRG